MQLLVTYIVLFVTAVKARFSDFLFFHCGPYVSLTSTVCMVAQEMPTNGRAPP